MAIIVERERHAGLECLLFDLMVHTFGRYLNEGRKGMTGFLPPPPAYPWLGATWQWGGRVKSRQPSAS